MKIGERGAPTQQDGMGCGWDGKHQGPKGKKMESMWVGGWSPESYGALCALELPEDSAPCT